MQMTNQQLQDELSKTNWVLIFMLCLYCLTVIGFSVYTRDLQFQMQEARSELDYYQHHYQERVGYRTSEHGVRELVRLLSIDGGKNWIQISEGREVLQPPYVHQRYPELELEQLTEVK